MIFIKNRKKLAWIVFIFIFITAIFCIAALAISITNYANADETQKADAAIILGAAVDNGAPSPVFRERINHGISLYQDGYVKYLIFTGGVGEGDSISEAQAGKNYAISMGIPENVILIEEESHITEENLKNAKALMEQNDLQTALIVSDPLHMKRSMLMAKDYGITAYSSPTKTTMYQSTKTKLPFLAREIVMYIGYGFVRLFQ